MCYMSRLDVVIFGATGFTGRKAVEETVKISKKLTLSWGVAGRSQQKLEELLVSVGNKLGEDLTKIRIIIADVKDEASLKSMSSQAKVVANCCGPYRMYGEPVIAACVASGTHHVDVSGEPQFIETMQLKYDKPAREAGVYVVSACGFDSVPNDMGVMYMKKHFGGTLNSVESYLGSKILAPYMTEALMSGSIHYGTWESLVYSLAHMKELKSLRQQLYPSRLPSLKPKLEARSFIHSRDTKYCLPFPGADNSIVYRTQRYLYEEKKERPVQFKAYIKMGSIFSTLTLIFNAIILYFMVKSDFTRSLLLKFPRLFSMGFVTKDGPKEEVMNNTLFSFDLYGTGWEEGTDVNSAPNKTMVVQVRGSNPGYGATVAALMQSAITVLQEKDKMPPGGGVLTTGAAFGNTTLIERLNESQLTFEIVNNK